MSKRITYLFITLLAGFVLHLNANAQEDGNVQFKSIDTGEYDGSVLLPRPVKKVIIDAGHGGKDEGAQGDNSQEKTINLAISQKLGEKIKMGFSDVTVVYTRRSDISLTLPERAEIANVQRGDLLISIHCNALRDKKFYGTEIYVVGNFEDGEASDAFHRENKISPNSLNKLQNYGDAFQGYSLEFAAKIDLEFRNYAGRKSLGVKREPFIVLRASNMPGVLIETGFLTNSEEENYLLSDSGQEQIAEAIYRAFVDYKAENDAVTMSFVPTQPLEKVVTPVPAPAVAVAPPPKVVTPPVVREIPVQVVPRPVVAAPSKVLIPSAATEIPTKVAAVSDLDSRTASAAISTSIPTTTPVVTNRTTTNYYPSSSSFKRETDRVNLPESEITDDVLDDLLEDAKYNAEADYIPQFRTEYKVQLLILTDQLDKTTPPWNEVYHLDIEQYGTKFSYLAAGYWDYESAAKGQNYWRTNGFPDAMIVTYKNGQRQ